MLRCANNAATASDLSSSKSFSVLSGGNSRYSLDPVPLFVSTVEGDSGPLLTTWYVDWMMSSGGGGDIASDMRRLCIATPTTTLVGVVVAHLPRPVVFCLNRRRWN